ncbi:MAG: ATP-NAD kinase family protein [Euryarchaeota archaeon]|nr:ATP-NAD kinase family protein [Euryarchaeota archaeon]
MGGAVALRGTDGQADEARKRGAAALSPRRAEEFVLALRYDVEIVTCAGDMGERVCDDAGLSCMIAYTPRDPSTAQDTTDAAIALKEFGVDLIAFVGGDGTARDVFRGVGASIPILGVPSGVKMFSAVFAENPRIAADIVTAGSLPVEREIEDIDEDAYRRDEYRVLHFGFALVPAHPGVQAGKSGFDAGGDVDSVARAVVAERETGVTYVLGPGTTLAAVKRALGVEATVLGVDVVRDGKVLAKDAGEQGILAVTREPARIIVSPIGRQGFILGRGNLQLSPQVLRRVGTGNVHVVSTWEKLHALDALRIDTGDAALDAAFPDYIKVLVGPGQTKMMRVHR